MKKLGDKIFVATGKDTVIAIEMLAVSPEEMGMKPVSGDGTNPRDHIRLAEVWDILGVLSEMNVREPDIDFASMKDVSDLKEALEKTNLLERIARGKL